MDKDSNISSPQDDGAGEKLVDEKNGHNSKGIEVKYVTPTSQNGDAKIDIENLKTAFAGMGKEELMKFANDPFWVRTRWFLFILFWLLWVAMLAGAIAIIVLAPKCNPPAPREWWEQSPLYKVHVDTFYKEAGKLQGDLKGVTSKLDYLKSLKIKTVVLSNILKVSDKNSDGVDEFKTIAPAYGTLEDFKALIAAATEKGLNLLLTLVPNHSSLKNDLFNKSVEGDQQYEDYYVWADAKGYDPDHTPIVPNNWLSVQGGPAWEWNDKKKKFYLHQFDKDEPDFNFHNPNVVQYFSDVMRFWLGLGVKGFYLERTSYLLEDADKTNETLRRTAQTGVPDHTSYDYLNHDYTNNLTGLVSLMKRWKSDVTNSSGIIVLDDFSQDPHAAHLVVYPQILKSAVSAEDITKTIQKTTDSNDWPTWQFDFSDKSEGDDLSQGLLLSCMLLPGTPITIAGQELGLKNLQEIPWDNSTGSGETVESQQNNDHSMFSAYKELVEARESPSILHGTMDLKAFNSTSVIGYTRIKKGNPGYLVVFNTGDNDTIVDVRSMDSVPEELTLLVTSNASPMANRTKIASEDVNLPPRAVAVFRFVPKSKD